MDWKLYSSTLHTQLQSHHPFPKNTMSKPAPSHQSHSACNAQRVSGIMTHIIKGRSGFSLNQCLIMNWGWPSHLLTDAVNSDTEKSVETKDVPSQLESSKY